MITTTLRLVQLLGLLPRRGVTGGAGLTAAQLAERLRELGWDVHLRSVERDLEALSGAFPIATDRTLRPQRWYWSGAAVQLPGSDVAGAVIWQLVAGHLRHLLPPALVEEIEPHAEAAQQVIEHSGAPLAQWAGRIARVPSTLEPQAPEVPRDVFAGVCTAVMSRRQLRVAYRARYREDARDYTLVPLGIVSRGSALYLIALANSHETPAHFALHRMGVPTLLADAAVDPPGFDLAEYVGTTFGYGEGGELVVELAFSENAAFHLSESTVADDQILSRMPDGRVLFQGTLEDSLQTRWWIWGFGAQVEVLGPAILREEFSDAVMSLSRRYGRRFEDGGD
jgi:predicted DNA-binding transcriptional regulator YafY